VSLKRCQYSGNAYRSGTRCGKDGRVEGREPQCGCKAFCSAAAVATCRACDSSAGVRSGNCRVTRTRSSPSGVPEAISLVIAMATEVVSSKTEQWKAANRYRAKLFDK
jgi:hypothetical protein